MRPYWRGVAKPPKVRVEAGLGGHYAPTAGIYFGTNALADALAAIGFRTEKDRFDAVSAYCESESPWGVSGPYVLGNGNHSKVYVWKLFVVFASQNNGASAACEHAIVVHGQEVARWATRQIERAAKAFGTPADTWEAPVVFAPDDPTDF